MADKRDDKPADKLEPFPWGSDPIKGLNYDYLDIDAPPATEPKSIMPDVQGKYNALQVQDFYQQARTKLVAWARKRGAADEFTKYVLLVPDILALMTRLMGDPRVSAQIKAEIAAASAYIVIPIDLLPEMPLGPAGLIDDAIVGMIALNRVVRAMGQVGEDVLRQYWDGDEDVLVVMENLLTNADQFVTGKVWNGIKQFISNIAQNPRLAPTDGFVVEGSYRESAQNKGSTSGNNAPPKFDK